MSQAKQKKRVLVVDDHPKVLKFIEIDLRLRGFEVSCACSGDEALDKVRAEPPDIMLLDILMPEKDGFTVLKELRGFSGIPVIAFSASPENQDTALECGANDFIHKPFDPEEAARKIRALLGAGD